MFLSYNNNEIDIYDKFKITVQQSTLENEHFEYSRIKLYKIKK